ncbi:flagellar filament capping protein FliD [Caldibacillus lycopersici]|uniref:Flagellar hook-associated protein 2 n=1 Tax=Perspicuibacillus lycopersici TaxID=1325689 RepID=A0AAE3IR96_9BACI|nr:flagellar filament capping protein FliD [Perspicuibacillus lycopersici]MCU9612976.1 flagellar filament capping protein FliD [Perspicuibacillus lycopersici]
MVMRVTGLASGMNIDEIVENMMKAESIPLNRMKQDKQILEWQRDSYREMNTLLLNFRTELTNMSLSSFYQTRNTGSSNEDKVTSTATSGAGQGSYSISNVTQLATAASKVNNGTISANSTEKIDPTKALYSIKDSFAAGGTSFDWKEGSVKSTTISVTQAGKEQTIGLASGTSIVDVENMAVKVNGTSYEVVTSEPAGGLADNQVLVDASTGKLTFKNDLAINSSIKVDYVANQNIQTKSINEDITELSIGGALVEGSVNLTMNGQQYSANGSNLVDSSGTAVGTIDYASGKITFNDTFRNLVKDAAAASGSSDEKPKVDIQIASKENYFSFGLTTQTSTGQVDEKFLISGSASLNTVMSKVNNSDAGVTMFYDSYSDKVTISRKETGNFNETGEEITTSGNFLNNVLGFSGVTEQGGQNATFTINGLETERTSNTFTMNGVTLTLKSTTAPGENITVNVSGDNDKLFENIKSFVDKYNEIVEKLQGKLSEEKYSDYLPLTDDDREKLTDKQQEQWEEKAKSGLLKNDSILSGFINSVRAAVYSPVSQDGIDPAMRTLSSIGITTTADYKSAKLTIDENKLKAAIEKDPESIEALFSGTGSTDSSKGIMLRLSDRVTQTMDQLKNRAGSTLSTNSNFAIGRELDTLDDRMETFQERLTMLETRYYAQFTAMEKAIQQANSQSTYISSLFTY